MRSNSLGAGDRWVKRMTIVLFAVGIAGTLALALWR
jgi:hypothetical protein